MESLLREENEARQEAVWVVAAAEAAASAAASAAAAERQVTFGAARNSRGGAPNADG